MSKFMSFVLSFLLFFDFFGCAALRAKFAQCAGLEMMQTVMVNPVYYEGELLTCQHELHWKGHEYEQFGRGEEYIGKLFGLTDRGGMDVVYLAVGQKPEEWLVWEQGGLMSWFDLYKEKSVTEIPDGFIPFTNE